MTHNNELHDILQIQLNQQKASYAPGDLISGTIKAEGLPSNTHKLAIRLLWYTTGKGTRDVNTCCEIVQAIGPTSSTLGFEFLAPHRPLSFSGQLISLQWAIEVVAFPSKQSDLVEIVIAHSDSEIILIHKEDELKRFGIHKPVMQLNSSRS